MFSITCVPNTYMHINDAVDFHWLLLPGKIWVKIWLFCIHVHNRGK